MLMTDEQYEELMSRLHLHNGHMEYIDFVLNFGDPRPPDSSSIIRSGNHHVNAIRGDEHTMTAEEVETKLRAKLRENFAVSFETMLILSVLSFFVSACHSLYSTSFCHGVLLSV